MKKVNYGFGGGSGDIFIAMRTKKFYFTLRAEDREELHRLYGGKQYYSSWSGRSGAGYLLPKEDDLLKVPGAYRASITHLSEAWPAELLGKKIMIPVEGITPQTPAVGMWGGELIFLLYPLQVLGFLLQADPFSGETLGDPQEVEYRYLSGDGEIQKFSIPWRGNNLGTDRSGRPWNLPYSFEEFAFMMEANPQVPSAKVCEEEVSFIERKLHLAQTEVGLARIGHFGLPVQKIEGELFPQDQPRNIGGWATQGFGSYQFAWKRVSGGTKVYAMVQAVPSQLNEKYSLLGDRPMEYELLVENVLEWFSQPIEYWVDKMKSELLKKVRSEFVNSARWDEGRQKEKVRELLLANPEAVFVIEDSLAVGNCQPGTESWMVSFGIKEPMTGQQFLDHKRFEEMLEYSRFRAVILNKLFVVDDDEEFVSDGHSPRRRVSKHGPRPCKK